MFRFSHNCVLSAFPSLIFILFPVYFDFVFVLLNCLFQQQIVPGINVKKKTTVEVRFNKVNKVSFDKLTPIKKYSKL